MSYPLSSAVSYSSVNEQHSWRPGALRRIPWSGLSALFGALIGMLVSIAILVASDGAPIDSWKYPPTVYLSIAYTITNVLLNTAFSKGVTINWWRKALDQGTVLGDLHRAWDFGNSAWAAGVSGRNFSFLAFACLLVAITPINGPLLQRASSVAYETVYSNPTISVQALRSIDYYTGYVSGRAYVVPLFSDKYNAVVQSYYNGEVIAATDTSCSGSGTCSGHLEAAGLAVNCSQYTVPFDISAERELPNGTFAIRWESTIGTDVFTSDFYWDANDSPSNVSLNMAYKADTPCVGDLIVKNCTLRAATVQYPVIIDGNKSTIALDPNSTIFDDVILDKIAYSPESYGSGSYLGGYTFALKNRFDTVSHMRFAGAAGYEIYSVGPTGAQFANLTDVKDYGMGFCQVKFEDPTEYLLQQARELMFRAALAGGNSTNVQTIQGGTQATTTSVYRSHYLFLGLAVGVSFAAILIVLANFRGYWHLGRKVTMSPIEVAKAFNAPVLAQEHSNAAASELIKGVGDRLARYGVVHGTAQEAYGKYGEHMHVMTADQGQMHLEIADPSLVQPLKP